MSPLPSYHSCRITNPNQYDRIRYVKCDEKVGVRCVDVLYGIKGNKSEIQALRYDKKIWEAGDARNHCKTRKGTFEPASDRDAGGEEKTMEEEKRAIPYKDHGAADEGAEWDAGREVRTATVEKLGEMCAWYDPENPDVKGSYKLPHHRAGDLKAVWRGVAAAMGALLGARGGVDIPQGERKATYAHISKHYAHWDKDPPDFKSAKAAREIYVKSDGAYVRREMDDDEFVEWFKSHADDDGNVNEDCLLYKGGDIEVGVDKSLTFVMSDYTLDRDFERIDPAGWDLKAYRKNPVLLWGHDRSRPAIGTMAGVRVKEERLMGNPAFDDEDEFAVGIKKKVEKRIVRSGSVGFFPVKVEIIEDEKDPTRIIFRKQELREFSLCNVPANPNATVIDQGKAGEGTAAEDTVQVLAELGKMKKDIEMLMDMQMTLSDEINKARQHDPLDELFRGVGAKPGALERFFEEKQE